MSLEERNQWYLISNGDGVSYSEEITKKLEKLKQYTVELDVEKTNSCVLDLQEDFRLQFTN